MPSGANETQPLLRDQVHLEDQTPHATITPLPKAQLAALCIARLSDPISYTQLFPYINEFLTVLNVTDDPSKIGFYSGLVVCVRFIWYAGPNLHFRAGVNLIHRPSDNDFLLGKAVG
jgi:hypothetical protein